MGRNAGRRGYGGDGVIRTNQPLYSDELAERICIRIAQGETLMNISEDEGYPNVVTIRKWVRDDYHGFRGMYAVARKMQADHFADEILEIADETGKDFYEDPKTGEMRVDHEAIRRSEIRISVRKYLMATSDPKRYSERIQAEFIEVDNPNKQVTLEDRARAFASLMARAKSQGVKLLDKPSGELAPAEPERVLGPRDKPAKGGRSK